MAKENLRFRIASLGPSSLGQAIYQGGAFFAVEGPTEGLASVALDAVALRGTEADSENVARIARTRRFWAAKSDAKLATLAGCFDLDALFGEFTAETLPTRYLRTYAAVERQWGKRPWARKHDQDPGPGALEPKATP